MGILRPDRGSVTLLGDDSNGSARQRVGYLPEERGVYKKMKVIDHLEFLGEIRGMTRAIARQRAMTWLERLGLLEWAGKRVEDLSKGMQQKVQFIGTVLHDPELLIPDEPFSGLDPINQNVLEEIVRDFHARGTTIVFSTHLMDQAERLCESVCLISRAEKVLDGDSREIKHRERSGLPCLRSSDGSGKPDCAGGRDLRTGPIPPVGPGSPTENRLDYSGSGRTERSRL